MRSRLPLLALLQLVAGQADAVAAGPIIEPLPPEWVPFNTNGYQFWAVARHPVTVS